MRPADRRTTPTVFDVVRRAVEICDPDGHEEAPADFLGRFENRDEPASALGERRAREFFAVAEQIKGEQRDPTLVMTAAVATYLVYRRDEIDDDPDDIVRLAARAEFGDDPPADVAAWLEDTLA